MRVLCINPNSAPALNTGLTYVMSAAGKNHEIKLLDLGLYGKKYQAALGACLKDSPQIIAISAVTQNFERGRQVAGFVKQRFPEIKIIFGGVHPTLCPQEVIAQPEIDAICIGEGEGAFKEYLESLERNADPLVAGIWFKDSRGSLIKNPIRPFEQDLDTLPFPNWDYWDIEYYIKHVDLERVGFISSRGCPYSCTFCSHAALRQANSGNYMRIRKPEQVIAEIECSYDKYQKYGFKYAKFDDDIFGLDRRFLEEFCALYIKKGLYRKLPWFCQTRADLVTDDYADLIAAAGCAIIGFGVESGDDATRTGIYKKGVDNHTIAKAVERLKKRNISYIFYFIYNSPYANKRENKKMLKLIKDLNPLRVNFTLYMHLPKTELENRLMQDRVIFPPAALRPFVKTGPLKSKLLLTVCLFYRVRNSIRSGLNLKGARFVLDAVRYLSLLLFRDQGKYPVQRGAERIFFQLEHFTLFKYAITRCRKNIQ